MPIILQASHPCLFKSSSVCRHNAVLTGPIYLWAGSNYFFVFPFSECILTSLDLLIRWLEKKPNTVHCISFPLDGGAEIGDVHPVEGRTNHLDKKNTIILVGS